MADSQVPYNYLIENRAFFLKESLSHQRFEPYLKKAGFNELYAFHLYLYNARLSKAFLFPLHVLEVSLRNRISAIFMNQFSASWPHDRIFRSILTQESLRALDTAISRSKTASTDDIVATLAFDFWSNLFRSEYDRDLWQVHMSQLLPNKKLSRKDFQKVIKGINAFRNRIAHHEPIHKINISQMHVEVLNVLEWICEVTQDWVKNHSTVNQVLRTSPSATGESRPHFEDRSDSNIFTVDVEEYLSSTFSNRFAICFSEGNVVAVLERNHIADFLFSKEENGEIILDMKTFTFSDVITSSALEGNFQECEGNESLSKASEIFTKFSYIVVRSEVGIVGVIAKAHRRY